MSVIAFDFDLTFADSLSPWLRWVNASGANPPVTMDSIVGKGDLVPYFDALGVKDSWEYWILPNLYDDMEPMKNAVEVLQALKDRGHTVICVSACTPEHLASKKRMIEKYVPFIDGFIDTHDKQFVDFDVIVDDSESMVLKMAEYGKKVIQPLTPPSELVVHPNVFNDPNIPYGKFWMDTHAVVELIEHWAGVSR